MVCDLSVVEEAAGRVQVVGAHWIEAVVYFTDDPDAYAAIIDRGAFVGDPPEVGDLFTCTIRRYRDGPTVVVALRGAPEDACISSVEELEDWASNISV